ncbi:mucin-17 isoform X3 [Hermetia illucens]|uniref:mucin-17 isoform X3 n=1 Tax=Hermetia illucens TaxID=343691 RepID=UPI0018CC4994|nr:mucin-17 isoform X3 [Hermetia illucens]
MQNREKDTRNVSPKSASNKRTSSPLEYNTRITRPCLSQPAPSLGGVPYWSLAPRDLSVASSVSGLPAPPFSASAILTDIGICVRMQNVHLTNVHSQRGLSTMPLPLTQASPKKQLNSCHLNPHALLNANTNSKMIINNNQNLSCDIIPSCCNFSKFQKVSDIITNGEKFTVSDFSTKQKPPENNVNGLENERVPNNVEMSRNHSSKNIPCGSVKQAIAPLQQSDTPLPRNSISKCKMDDDSTIAISRQSAAITSPVHQKNQLQNNHCLNQKEQQNIETVPSPKPCKDTQGDRRENIDTIATPPPKKKWIRHYMMAEEPCRNGEHPLASQPPSSYLLISAKNENGTASGAVTSTQLSDQVNSNSKAENCDPFLHHCNNKINNANNKTEIGSKCRPADQVLPSLQPTSSPPSALNAAYPPGSSRLLVTPSSRSPLPYTPPSKIKKITPLTPPPTSSRKLVEITRTRSSSLSSTNFTANVGSGAVSLAPVTGATHQTPMGLSTVVAAGTAATAAEGATAVAATSLLHSRIVANGGGGGNVLANSGTEDSSQSSLNLSSSGYLSGSSANSSVGVSSSSSNLNISNSSTSSLTPATVAGLGNLNGNGANEHQLPGQAAATTGRRRTTSTNSSGPCILRAGTREVHNKLEKHRRAHLKECFEQLKVQLQLHDEERKKTSNLAILGAAYRHVMSLKKKGRELEQQVEQLAKEKINYQKRILNLKRELSARHDFDFSSVPSDSEMMQGERDSLSDTLSSARGSATRYSSSSSLSSATTVPSPSGSGSGNMTQSGLTTRAISPQVSMPTSLSTITTLHTPPSPSNHPHHIHQQQMSKSMNPDTIIGNSVPLSLTTKQMPRSSPTPSTPSPSSSSMNGIPPSSPNVSSSGSPSSISMSSLSTSPPIIIPQSPLGGTLGGSATSPAPVPISLKITNVPNGVKVPQTASIISSLSTSSQHIPPSSSPLFSSSASNLTIISSTTNNSLGSSLASMTVAPVATSSPPVLNYTTSENSILSATPLTTATTINSGMPLNLNASASLPHVQIVHAGKNGICRKPNDFHEPSIISASIVATQQPQHQSHSSVSGVSASQIIVTNNASTATTITTKEKISESGEQHGTKCINLVNSIPLTSLDQATLSSSVIFPMLSDFNSQSIRFPPRIAFEVQQQPRNPPTSTARLLVGAATAVSTPSRTGPGVGSAVVNSTESARLPGGAEVNILPPNGKMALLNNGIALKGADGVGTNGRAVHVVTPIQPRIPIVVSQTHLAQLPNVNLTVAGRQLPMINTQYLNSMEPPVVVAVTNNQTASTLSSVPNTATSVAVATATANGGVS